MYRIIITILLLKEEVLLFLHNYVLLVKHNSHNYIFSGVSVSGKVLKFDEIFNRFISASERNNCDALKFLKCKGCDSEKSLIRLMLSEDFCKPLVFWKRSHFGIFLKEFSNFSYFSKTAVRNKKGVYNFNF